MSPFTADSKVITEILKGTSPIWKSLHGPIESIKITERKDKNDKSGSLEQTFKIEVKTSRVDASLKTNPPDFPACTGLYEVKAQWNFMDLKDVQIREISLKCET